MTRIRTSRPPSITGSGSASVAWQPGDTANLPNIEIAEELDISPSLTSGLAIGIALDELSVFLPIDVGVSIPDSVLSVTISNSEALASNVDFAATVTNSSAVAIANSFTLDYVSSDIIPAVGSVTATVECWGGGGGGGTALVNGGGGGGGGGYGKRDITIAAGDTVTVGGGGAVGAAGGLSRISSVPIASLQGGGGGGWGSGRGWWPRRIRCGRYREWDGNPEWWGRWRRRWGRPKWRRRRRW